MSAVPSPTVGLRLHDPRLRGWGFPVWGSAGAAGLDLHACLAAPLVLEAQAPPVLIPAGFAVSIADRDWCGLVMPRSGLGHGVGLVLGNTVGVIDADYEGEILVSAWNRNPPGTAGIAVAPGDRIAQLVFTRIARPAFAIVEAGQDEPSRSREGRGAGGFGSTGLR